MSLVRPFRARLNRPTASKTIDKLSSNTGNGGHNAVIYIERHGNPGWEGIF